MFLLSIYSQLAIEVADVLAGKRNAHLLAIVPPVIRDTLLAQQQPQLQASIPTPTSHIPASKTSTTPSISTASPSVSAPLSNTPTSIATPKKGAGAGVGAGAKVPPSIPASTTRKSRSNPTEGDEQAEVEDGNTTDVEHPLPTGTRSSSRGVEVESGGEGSGSHKRGGKSVVSSAAVVGGAIRKSARGKHVDEVTVEVEEEEEGVKEEVGDELREEEGEEETEVVSSTAAAKKGKTPTSKKAIAAAAAAKREHDLLVFISFSSILQ